MGWGAKNGWTAEWLAKRREREKRGLGEAVDTERPKEVIGDKPDDTQESRNAVSGDAHPLTRNKYGNRPTGLYASAKEARRAAELQLREKAGEIYNLREQMPFVLIQAQYGADGKCIERSCKYIADFIYNERDGAMVVEDCKGYQDGPAYALFSIKRKLMLFVHHIQIKEV